MDFSQVFEKYCTLKKDFAEGRLSAVDFEDQVNQLSTTDSTGATWQIGVKTGKWYRYDGSRWVEATPPDIQPPPLTAVDPAPQLSPAAQYLVQAPETAPYTPPSKKRKTRTGLVLVLILLALAALVVTLFLTHAFTITINGVDILQPIRTLLFQDDFSDITSGWDQYSGEMGFFEYGREGYHIYVGLPNMIFWATPQRSFPADVSIEVDSTYKDGPKGSSYYGIICRYEKTTTDARYYAFLMGPDGLVGIGKYEDGETSMLSGQGLQTSPAVKTEYDSINRIRADCLGNSLTLYINGQKVASAKDASFPAGGVGLMAGTFDQAGTDVLFDNFAIYQP
jgi:hypothetical protein